MPESAGKGNLIGEGNTAEIFEWGDHEVLKLYRSGLPEDLCKHEFEITQYAYEYLKIAPKPIELIKVDGRIGVIYERLRGTTMLRLLLSKPWRLHRYSKMLAHCHFKMQKTATLSTRTVKEKLCRDIDNAPVLSLEEKQSIKKYLDSLPDGDCICHFDFHPDNIMLQDDQCYVIDWMTGCIGDPLADVARTALLLNYTEIPRAPYLVKIFVKVCQKRIYRVYVSEYLKLTGSNILDIQKWELPLAAARLCECTPEGELKKLLGLVKRLLEKKAG